MSFEGLLYGDAVIKEMNCRNLIAAYTTSDFQRKIGQFFSNITGRKIAISEQCVATLLEKFAGDSDYLVAEFGLDMTEKYEIMDLDSVYDPESIFPELDNFAKVQVDILEQSLVEQTLLEQFLREQSYLLDGSEISIKAEAGNIAVFANKPLLITVQLSNDSLTDIYTATGYPIKLAYAVNKAGSNAGSEEYVRLEIESPVIRKKSVLEIVLMATAPPEPGNYTFTVTMVQERHAWLHDRGLVPAVVDIDVR